MKKKILLISLSLLIIVIGFIVSFYFINLGPTNSLDGSVLITIKPGMNMKQIAKSLKEEKVIRNVDVFLIYTRLNNINAQSGPYMFEKTDDVPVIAKKINEGLIYKNEYRITFIEGKTLKNYLKQISLKIELTEDEMIKQLADKSYLETLISKYWFLTEDILNKEIYFPLEGYLFPDTYDFLVTANLKTIIGKMLDNTQKKLEPYKNKIESENLNVHEILTMASIIEKEANSPEDRKLVSGVFYNRLRKNISLGSDVTTYYAEQIEMGTVKDLYQSQYDSINAYNTRPVSKLGLPVGPICNPSKSSIEAAINPTETDYLFFFASKDGTIYYSKTNQEHDVIRRKYKW